MKYFVGLFVLICSVTISLGSSLRCYKCSDYYGGWCDNVQECSYEDSCLSLHEKGGKTIRQCIRYTDCNSSRLSQMFPAVTGFTFRCCNSNLCNSGHTVGMPVLCLVISLLGLWWCWRVV